MVRKSIYTGSLEILAMMWVLSGCGGRVGTLETEPIVLVDPPVSNFWQPTNAPEGTDFRALVMDNNGYLFAASSKTGVLRSNDNGMTWSGMNTGLSNSFVYALTITPAGELLAGTDGGGVFRSTDAGVSWLPVGLPMVSVWSIVGGQGGLTIVGTDNGVYRSTDNGGHWAHLTNILTDQRVFALALLPDGDLLAGTELKGVFVSHDNGDSWLQTTLSSSTVRALNAAANADIYVATSMGVFRLYSQEGAWAVDSVGLTNAWAMVVSPDGQVFAGTKGGVFRSSDRGLDWQPVNGGLATLYIRSCIAGADGHLIVGTNAGGMYRSLQPVTQSH